MFSLNGKFRRYQLKGEFAQNPMYVINLRTNFCKQRYVNNDGKDEKPQSHVDKQHVQEK